MAISPVDCALCMAEFMADPMAQHRAIAVSREDGPKEAETWFIEQYADIHNAHSVRKPTY